MKPLSSLHLVGNIDVSEYPRGPGELWVRVELAAEHEHQVQIQAYRTAIREAIGSRFFHAVLDDRVHARIADDIAMIGTEVTQMPAHFLLETLNHGLFENSDLCFTYDHDGRPSWGAIRQGSLRKFILFACRFEAAPR